MNTLPDLCLRRIFSFLDLRSLVKCRAVCRLFKYYANGAKVNSLVVNEPPKLEEAYWYLTDRPIKLEGSISLKSFHSLRPSQFKLRLHLKFLCIYLDEDSLLNFKFLNRFKQLVQLEIEWSDSGEPENIELNLPHLKHLRLCEFFDSSRHIVLNTPKLEVLGCDRIANVQLEHPASIKHLYSDYNDAVLKLINIELFRCYRFDGGLNRHLLSHWTNANELSFELKWEFYDSLEYENFRNSVTYFLTQKAIMRSKQPKIYLNHVLLLNANQLEDFEFMKSVSNFQLKNYKLIREDRTCHAVTQVNYNDLMRWHSKLSGDFFDKFPAIQTVEASGVVDQEQFEAFLDNLKMLCELILNDTSLNQETFLTNLLLQKVASQSSRLKIIFKMDSDSEDHPAPAIEDILAVEDVPEIENIPVIQAIPADPASPESAAISRFSPFKFLCNLFKKLFSNII